MVSGNVHQVAYQQGETDQYFHRYYYDADNRITHVFTSTDNRHWDNDAKYFYYKHGPLARKEIGNQKVQGEDYAYTIQGWIKGTNSNSLNTKRDMGKDGENDSSNPNRFFANDAAAYALHYFENDYIAKAKADGSYNAQDFFLMQTDAASYLNTQAPNLYNGNIRAMVTTVRSDNASGNNPVASLTAYQYDQLNRIKQMKMYRDANLSTNAWGNGASYSGAFEEHYVYDHNGNILQQKRNGNATTIAMDNLRYYYYKQDGTIFDPLVTATPSNATNKLAYVTDAVGAGNYTADIDNQSSGNYTYDGSGRLKKDIKENIGNIGNDGITWTNTNKVKSIRRQGSGSEANIDYCYNNMGHKVKKVVKGRNAGAALGQDQWEYTYYVYDAAGNVMAIYDRNYNGLIGGNYADILTVSEQNIYGSSRLGQVKSNRSTTSNFTASYSTTDETGALYFTNLNYTSIAATGDGHTYTNNAQLFQRSLGLKEYELSNHLGNVNVVISDRKKSIDIASDGTTDYYLSEVKSYTDFYAFGSVKPGRVYQAEQYRYSLNGQEREHEITGSPSHSSAEYWMYDSRIARRWEIDPVYISELSPYSTYNLNPIRFNDPKGLSGEDAVRKASRSARRASRKEKKELKKEIEKIWDDLGDNAVRSCLKGLRIEELRAIKEKANGDLELFKDFKIWGNPLKPVVVLDKKPNFIVSFFISAEAFFNGLKGSSNELPFGVAIEAEKGGNPHGTHESDKYTSKNILFSIEHEHIELIDNLLSVAKLRDEYYSGARKNLFNTDFGKMSNKDLLWWLIRNYKPILDAGKDELVENYIEDAIKEAHYRNLHPKHDKRLIKIKYTNGNEIYYFKATEHSKIDSTMRLPSSGGYKYLGSRDDGSSTRSWTADKDSLFQQTSK